MPFSLAQLRAVRSLVAARIEAGADDARWSTLLAETDAQLALVAPRELVFRLELPIEPVDLGKPGKPCMICLTPSMNLYSSMQGWAKAKARTEVDRRIVVARAQWPKAHCGLQKRAKIVGGEPVIVPVSGTGRRRLVRVVRHSSRRIDEISVDLIGGKLPVDRIRQADIIAGDSAKWLEREAAWEPCMPGDGKLMLEIYDLIGPAATVPPRARCKR